MSALVRDDLSDVLREMFVGDEAFAYYGTRDYDDEKPEPEVPVGDVIRDRDGLPWSFTPFDWVAAGDGRPQQWCDIQMWFD